MPRTEAASRVTAATPERVYADVRARGGEAGGVVKVDVGRLHRVTLATELRPYALAPKCEHQRE